MEEPARRRREPPDVRREQILDAAERVLLERGLGVTTIADVANAAAIGKGTIYLYYDSKAAVLAGLRARYLERFADALGRAPRPGERSCRARLDRFVRELFDFSVAHSELHHLLFQEAGFSEEDAFASTRALLGELVAEGVQSGEFHVDDTELVTDFLFHGLHGALVHALQEPHPDRRRFNARAITLAHRTLDIDDA